MAKSCTPTPSGRNAPRTRPHRQGNVQSVRTGYAPSLQLKGASLSTHPPRNPSLEGLTFSGERFRMVYFFCRLIRAERQEC